MSLTNAILTAVATILAACRVGGLTHEAFQAVAHLFVGGLAGAWLISHRPLYAELFWGLTVVETVCFLLNRFLV